MLIATLGPTSAAAGKTIIWNSTGDGQFVLVGAGPMSAAEVMRRDGAGQLVWASDELRAWVASRAQQPAPQAIPSGSSTMAIYRKSQGSTLSRATRAKATPGRGVASHARPQRPAKKSGHRIAKVFAAAFLTLIVMALLLAILGPVGAFLDIVLFIAAIVWAIVTLARP